jgi:predicted transcriptional regulator
MKKRKPSGRLGSRERELIEILFSLGNRASAEEIRAQIDDAPTSSSVRVMLGRLETKGHVRHVKDGVRYVYSATESPRSASRSLLQKYLDTFFGGSLHQMVTALVRNEPLTDGELESLQAEIQHARKERRR